MRIGYAWTHRNAGCTQGPAFRLPQRSRDILRETVRTHLDTLEKTLCFNAARNLLFFRAVPGLVPFAHNRSGDTEWDGELCERFSGFGDFVSSCGMRIAVHPSPFTAINAIDSGIVARSTGELRYHAELFDLFGLDDTAKIPVRIGGIYGNRARSLERFVAIYEDLRDDVKRRLVIGNDERRYGIEDCLEVHSLTGVPVVLDVMRFLSVPQGLTLREAFLLCSETWGAEDGLPIVEFGSRETDARPEDCAESVSPAAFKEFVETIAPFDCDIMMEYRDRELSALAAIETVRDDPRFIVLERV